MFLKWFNPNSGLYPYIVIYVCKESYLGNIIHFSVVFSQSVCFVSDGWVVNRGQKSVSFLDHQLDRPIMRLNHQ